VVTSGICFSEAKKCAFDIQSMKTSNIKKILHIDAFFTPPHFHYKPMDLDFWL